jgi:hypothetical protein
MKTLTLILALALTGCSALEQKLRYPPNTLLPNTVCEKNESLLMCDSTELDNCWGYLEDKPLIIIEETEL